MEYCAFGVYFPLGHELHRVEPINPAILKYLNRLSDALFVFGRWVTAKLDETELLWQPGSTRPDWRWSTND